MENEVRELLDAVRRKEEGSFERLSQKYSSLTESMVRGFASSFGISGEAGRGANVYDMDDLRQHAAMALYRAAAAYRPDEEGKEVSFGLYAKVCVRNALISELRRYRREMRKRAAEKPAEEQKRRKKGCIAAGDPLYRMVSEEAMRETLTAFRETLSGYEKEVFEYYIVGKSITEIAERLGKDEKSVSNALYRMKVKIRGLLKK